MTNVFAPRAGVPGIIASLQKLGLQIVDIIAGAVGVAGTVQTSDGSGGLAGSRLQQSGNDLVTTGGAVGALQLNFRTGQINGDSAAGSTLAFNGWQTFTVGLIGGSPFPLNMTATTRSSLLGASASNPKLLAHSSTENSYYIINDLIHVMQQVVASPRNVTNSDMERMRTLLLAIGGVTVNLPSAAASNIGRRLTVVDWLGNAGASPHTIAASGGQTINGAASIQITTNYGFITLQSDGDISGGAGAWVVVARG